MKAGIALVTCMRLLLRPRGHTMTPMAWPAKRFQAQDLATGTAPDNTVALIRS